MHFLRTFRRVHPDRESTFGLIGHVATEWVGAPGTGERRLATRGICGLETWAALSPAEPALRPFLKDGRGQPYFVGPLHAQPVPNVLHSTIDLELQREAVRQLTTQAEAGAREGNVTVPKWGAMVLVEMDTGDLLAAASWHRDARHPEAAAFTPSQSLYEPGSIVKPLVFAYALEAGMLDWSHEFDCRPGSSDYRERISSLGSRIVSDDHHCDVLTPHGILVNSSNIGAAYVGLQLEREQWHGYMQYYGFGTPLSLRLPNESRGGPNAQSFDPSIPLRSFRRNSAISFSFGYEMQVTALSMARAYLRLFRGGGADLRICRGVEIGGEWHAAPAAAAAGPKFRPEVVELVREAMVDVVSADPHATGSYMHGRMLKETGIDLHGVLAGKTGTAASRIGIPGRGKVDVRNASFVGVFPAEAPRWLAVCVLQKDDSARFYGGSYAAPPAVRLLLQCQNLEQRRQRHKEPQLDANGQVRAVQGSPGDSGWGR
jgi:cell division protein FtsI (penicillin-binding protein 3)